MEMLPSPRSRQIDGGCFLIPALTDSVGDTILVHLMQFVQVSLELRLLSLI